MPTASKLANYIILGSVTDALETHLDVLPPIFTFQLAGVGLKLRCARLQRIYVT